MDRLERKLLAEVARTSHDFSLLEPGDRVLVAVSGAVGFVGLMLPHLTRMVVGADHRKVLPLVPLAGASFLVWVDVAARMLAAPEELPLGVITAAIGVPCFVVLMRRKAYVFGGR